MKYSRSELDINIHFVFAFIYLRDNNRSIGKRQLVNKFRILGIGEYSK